LQCGPVPAREQRRRASRCASCVDAHAHTDTRTRTPTRARACR
jgi:hypothetical protein